ncbi:MULTISPECIES: hypothetical protein [Pseudomonas]|uniref:Uncharacterized protein n=1 Tax=Phytopseudomonas flavescens TaxID=29435 RepID=A0A7Y9XQD3_9GAMM|nr:MULTISPECIES: hypothetical protein [Pseudomonas]MCW2291207.1 hypothetical protein [Pseudomonas sp. BIGb0408]NYH74222.1 hypothetical protein [Pseudomonas flavescens]
MNVNVTDNACDSTRATYQDVLSGAGSLRAQRPMEEDDEPLEQDPGWNTDAQPDELPQEQPEELPQDPGSRQSEI